MAPLLTPQSSNSTRRRVVKDTRKTYHLPPKDSIIIAINLSKLPKIARWIITGLLKSTLISDVDPVVITALASGAGVADAAADDSEDLGARYFKLKRSGKLKSS